MMRRGQLQHRSPLTLTQLGHEHMASVRKLDRVMVTMGDIRLNRAEFPNPEIDCFRPDPSIVVSDVFGERQFGPGQHADRHRGLIF